MSKTPTLVVEIPLKTQPNQEISLEAMLEAARQLYNACLGEAMRRLRLMRQSKSYQEAKKLKKKSKERSESFKKVREEFGFSEYSLHSFAATIKNSWIGEHLGIHIAQKLATRAFRAVEKVAFGFAKRVRFKRKGQLFSIEGKNNQTGLIWKQGTLKLKKLVLSGVLDASDPVIMHGVKERVKYCRLKKQVIRGKSRYSVQLCVAGCPLSANDRKLLRSPKAKVEESSDKIAPGGSVGIDIGPSTVAIVGSQNAKLVRFCDELESKHAEIRQLQRKLDRQRRANNPDNYDDNGTVKKGKKKWFSSQRQKQTERELRELHRCTAAHRKSLHGALINSLPLGEVFKLEKLSYRGFQKNFGRSVGMRAPGMFVDELKRKALDAGGSVEEFSTKATKLSQTCHCGKEEKKSLSERWHQCECGVHAQRDLYSAYLARFVQDEKLDAASAKRHWQSAESLLRAAIEFLKSTSRKALPSSFGIRRRQSGSSAKVEIAKGKAANVVVNHANDCRELQRASGVSP